MNCCLFKNMFCITRHNMFQVHQLATFMLSKKILQYSLLVPNYHSSLDLNRLLLYANYYLTDAYGMLLGIVVLYLFPSSCGTLPLAVLLGIAALLAGASKILFYVNYFYVGINCAIQCIIASIGNLRGILYHIVLPDGKCLHDRKNFT